MYRGGAAGCELADAVRRAVAPGARAEVVVAPPFTALAAVAETVRGATIGVAGQSLHPGTEGAFTGEVSGPMLVECGATWVIVGHSERRQLFGETDANVQAKVAAAAACELVPIACVGETLAEREAGRTLEVVSRQLAAILAADRAGVSLVVAYEPVWAIGTGRVAGPDQAEEVHAALRVQLERHDPALAAATRILYGGSVKPENAAGLLACPNVDGALVGGASLDAAAFAAIVAAAEPG
ncbi:MAG: triose-phosphate isomerase [Polyangiaceae bacterium]|nr:triose-phosphate isomerase [Polyangiaceae bacterium]